MVDFGKKLKISRLHSGLTQEELAERIGVSRGSIARYELGEMEPKISNLIALAKALNVSVDYLLGVGKENRFLIALTSMLSTNAITLLQAFIDEIMKTANDRREDT